MLVDESTPGFAAPIAQHNSEAIGNTGDGAAVRIAKRIAHRFFTHLFGGAAPNVAELVPQTQVFAVPEAVQARVSTLFLEIEEAARHFTVDSPAFEDTLVDH